MTKTAHIIGAGLSGLSAAVRLAHEGYQVHIHEATQNAGGRCRSYFDGATNMVIDNGNHLLLSGNMHARLYALSIGTETKLVGPESAEFHFVDVSTGKKWLLDLGKSRLPLWLFNARKRVPDTRVSDYLKLMPLAWASTASLVGNTITCEGTLYRRLVHPLLLSALNIDPPKGSAGLAGAIVRETLLAGGNACRPLIAREGLSAVLVDPALEMLQAKGATIKFSHELRHIETQDDKVTVLDFGEDTIALGTDDVVVLAVPARPASSIILGLKTPTKFRAIVNAHFRYDPPE
ncbi:MAG TPA: FAD-dependent oxidoreductase, partial [Afipia sp.]